MNVFKVLAELVRQGNRFRNTPIVDDDFPTIRNEFDHELDRATSFVKSERPRIVCLCGSTRFHEAFREANLRETLAGRIVLTVGCDTKSDQDLFGTDPDEMVRIKSQLDQLHLRKIELADEVLILNVGGYIGDSTRRELEHAIRIGKRVRYLEPK